jgi:hypothetical protein
MHAAMPRLPLSSAAAVLLAACGLAAPAAAPAATTN